MVVCSHTVIFHLKTRAEALLNYKKAEKLSDQRCDQGELTSDLPLNELHTSLKTIVHFHMYVLHS